MLTPEELEFRRTKIGASDAAPILGISPWKTAHDLWKDKIYGQQTKTNSSMKRGNDLEPIAREEFEKLTGLCVMPIMKVNPKIEWQMATFDGMTFDESAIVEIKCPNKAVHQMALDGKLPDYYFSQVQHQMCVAGLDKAFYFSWNGSQGALVEVKRDQGYIDALLEKETEFWDLMKSKTAPPFCAEEIVEIQDQEWKALAEEFKALSIMEERKESIRKRLLELSGHKNCLGSGIRVIRKNRLGAIDYKSIEELKTIDLEKYRKKGSEYFEISIVK